MQQEALLENDLLYEFGYVIHIDPLVGYLMEAHAVEISAANREYTCLSHKVYENTSHNYGLSPTDTDIKLMQLSDEISFSALEDKFVKKIEKKRGAPKTLELFLAKKENAAFLKAFVEKKLHKIFSLAVEHNKLNPENEIKFFFRHKKGDWFTRNPISVSIDPLDATFHFNRGSDNIIYKLFLHQKNEPVQLVESEFHALISEPGWVIVNNVLYHLQGNITANNLKPFSKNESISIPHSMEQEYFRKFIIKTAKNQHVVAEGFEISDSTVPMQSILAPELNIFLKKYGLILKFKYGEETFLADDKRENNISIGEGEKGQIQLLKTVRSNEEEFVSIDMLEGMGLQRHHNSSWFFPENGQDVFYWLIENNAQLKKAGFITGKIIIQDRELLLIKPKINFDVQNYDSDWFGLNATVNIGTFSFPFISFRYNILNNIREYDMPDGSITLLPEEWFSRYREIFLLAEENEGTLRISRSRTDLVPGIEMPEQNQEVFSELPEVSLPEGLEATLRPYQVTGFRWLENLRQQKLGGCLADEMGLGKTLQTLAFLLHVKENELFLDQEEDEPQTIPFKNNNSDLFSMIQQDLKRVRRLRALVVMPLSLVHNWMAEAQKFTPTLKIYSHTGTGRVERPDIFHLCDIVFTTYNTLRNDPEVFGSFKFNFMILDESQYIKNPKSKIYKAVTNVKSRHRFVLTGTPVENSLSDLWAQMNFINPGMLGSFSFFKNEYITAVEKENDLQKRKKLKEIVGPYILRRTIHNVAKDLPELSEQVFFTEMEPGQKKMYEEERSKARNLIMDNLKKFGTGKSQMLILRSLMKLRQIANHPLLVKSGNDDEVSQLEEKAISNTALQQSGKFNDVINLIEQIVSEGNKVLVFSQFVSHLDIFKQWLNQQKIGYSMLNGTMDQFTRKKNIEKFNEKEEIKVFLVSLKAGGTGLNLTAASYVIMLDPWWNPAVEKQAVARAYRIGQKNNVISYKFIAKDTVEEKILKLQQKKQELANDFLPASNLGNLTDEEIGYLLE